MSENNGSTPGMPGASSRPAWARPAEPVSSTSAEGSATGSGAHSGDEGSVGRSARSEESPAWAQGARPNEEGAAERPGPSGDDTEPALRAVPAPVGPAAPAWADPVPSPQPRPKEVDEGEFAAEPGEAEPKRSVMDRRKWIALAGGGAAVLLLVVVVAVIVSSLPGGEDDSAADKPLAAALEEEAAPAPTAAPAKFTCEESSSGGQVTGNGAGDRKSVPGIVLAFEDAYYNSRDAKKATELTDTDSPFRPDEAVKVLQSGIDAVPAATDYCVTVTPDGDKATVEIVEARPSAAPETFTQTFSTKRDGDRVSITDIQEQGQ